MSGYDEPHLFMEGYFYQKYGKISNTITDLKGLFPMEDKSSKNQTDLSTEICKYSFPFLDLITLKEQKFVVNN